MKQIISIIISVLFLSCATNIDLKIDELFRDYIGEVPGASILIIKDGKKIIEKSYGLANLEKKIPVKHESNFRLASVTKQFTAMCILQLIEKGKLNLNDKLTNVFSDFPEYGNKIKIYHLLQHTSGLIDYEDLINKSDTTQVLDKGVLNMMLQVDSTYFKPGTKFRYSNSAYAVLAMIVEKLSGLTFAEYLKQNIFIPLNMYQTVAFEKGISTIVNRVYGYAFENGRFVYRDQSTTSAVLGDGGIYSSIDDLYKWDQALYTYRLISTNTLNMMFSKGVLSDIDSIYYGFGWYVRDFNGEKCVFHTGSSCGFRNIIYRLPEKNITIIILTNRDTPDLKHLTSKILNYLLDKYSN